MLNLASSSVATNQQDLQVLKDDRKCVKDWISFLLKQLTKTLKSVKYSCNTLQTFSRCHFLLCLPVWLFYKSSLSLE